MLDVIGAGFGRTGTMSLKTALEQIDLGPCYHMFEVFQNQDHDALWLQAHDGSLADWEEIFARYRSAVDWPASAFYAPLMRRYREAKVVLTVRDPDAWYESARTTIHARVDESGAAGETLGDEMRRRIIWQGVFDGRFDDRAHAIGVFERHIDEVRRTVPPERLLVYDVREGWGPLCRFLGRPEPDAPFPYLNTGEDFRRRAAERRPAR
jgi:hypothetical protein